MPEIEKLSIALPAEMAASVRMAVEKGEYSSNSEVIREALRDWTHKRKLREREISLIRAKVQEALADESHGLDPAEVLARLEKRLKARAR